MSSQAQLQPTFQGYIGSTTDALLLFECCLAGSLRHVSRRAHDRERHSLIKSGNVFIYEENTSGIKRWTDGISWSPSRILGNFLVYRQLERPFPPGEKKRAKKNRNKISGGVKSQSSSEGLNSGEPGASSSSYSEPGAESGLNKETTRMLFGSLEDSYDFKKDGLIKKTISVTVNGTSHHLVSYYTVADILANRLTSPTRDPQFTGVNLRDELTPQRQNFRTPIDEVSTL
ncbi:Gti1/Pac2 family-domain-containing protein, partial [Bisporella sp. PMI_857]